MSGKILVVGTMQQQFSITFKAPIWQIRPDSLAGLLGLEIRDGDRLHTEFAVLDVNTGKLALSGYQAKENWWIGLEDMGERILFLHGFGNRRLGTHQGLWALDIDSGEIAWEQPQAIFFGLMEGNNLVIRQGEAENNLFTILDFRTGLVLESAVSAVDAQAAVTLFNQERRKEIIYPIHHPETSEHFALLSRFLLNSKGVKTIKAIDYLEAREFFAVGYYEAAEGDKLKNTLSIYNSQDGTCLNEVIITAHGNGLALDSFFLMKDILITIQEKDTVIGIAVNNSLV